MTISAVNSNTAAAQLVKLGNGEYTASSVQADAKDASRLGLVKEKDGNYGTSAPAPAPAESKSAPDALTSLAALKLGGA